MRSPSVGASGFALTHGSQGGPYVIAGDGRQTVMKGGSPRSAALPKGGPSSGGLSEAGGEGLGVPVWCRRKGGEVVLRISTLRPFVEFAAAATELLLHPSLPCPGALFG